MRTLVSAAFGRCLLLAIVAAAALGSAEGQSTPYRSPHNFGGSVKNADGASGPDGMFPSAGSFDRSGDFYGTAINGGAYGATNGGGMAYEISENGAYRDLHDFGGTVTNASGQTGLDGIEPYCTVTIDKAGNLYGTTSTGGPHHNTPNGAGAGMLWEITAAGAYIDLHDFGGTVANANGKSGPDGYNAQASVTVDSAGNLYGTASSGGGLDGGMIWELTATGSYIDLHDFGGKVLNADAFPGWDGNFPIAGVSFDSAGNMYGTTAYGSPYGVGMIWEIAGGIYKDLHDFGRTVTNADGKPGLDGATPCSAVAIDGAGNLYGTTYLGGPNENYNAYGDGMVWEVLAGGGYKDLHDFGGTVTNANGTAGSDGAAPNIGVTVDRFGDVFGTADFGGPNDQEYGGAGIVWEITATHVYKDLHDFGGEVTTTTGQTVPDGATPDGGVTFDAAGNLCGTCTYGGYYDQANGGDGMMWVLAVSAPAGVSIAPVTITGGANAIGTVNLSGIAPIGGEVVGLGISSGPATVPASVTIAAGASSATFSVKTTSVASSSVSTISASFGSEVKTAKLTVNPPSLVSVVCSTVTLYGGTPTTGTLTISAPAPAGGSTINLASNSASVSVPASVLIPAGITSAQFSVNTSGVATLTTVTVTATSGPGTLSGGVKTRSLTIEAPILESVTSSPSSVVGGASSTGTVTINSPAPTGGFVVTLSSGASAVKLPATVKIPAGAKSATFSITTSAVKAQVSCLLTAAANAVPRTTAFIVRP